MVVVSENDVVVNLVDVDQKIGDRGNDGSHECDSDISLMIMLVDLRDVLGDG